MGLFRCLVSKNTTNYITGTDLGTSVTTVWTLINTPIVAGSVAGTIVREGTAIQTFDIDVTGAFSFAPIGTPSIYTTAGVINLGLGTITLTWNEEPGANYAITTYTGLPVYQYVTMQQFGVSCPPPVNILCNTSSTGYVAASVVCDQNLYTSV